MTRIIALRSGGQSGADRGAMDAARKYNVPIEGWCPKGGWAEDLTKPPGLLAIFPEMVETPDSKVIQRTEWNIRDSDCCIALDTATSDVSPGTGAGYEFYDKYSVPFRVFYLGDEDTYDHQIAEISEWLSVFDRDVVLGVGGPRASEYPGIYDIAKRITCELLDKFA